MRRLLRHKTELLLAAAICVADGWWVGWGQPVHLAYVAAATLFALSLRGER